MIVKHLISSLAVLFAGVLAVSSAHAVVIDGGPAWPGSANVTGVSGAGPGPSYGGDTWTYPNTGSSNVASLYFGLGGNSGFSMNGPGVSGSEIFTWFADVGNSIEYRGSTTVTTATTTGSTTTSRLTRLLLTALSGATVVSDATTQALGSGAHSLFDIALGAGSFIVNRRIEVWTGATWTAANPYFDGLQTSPGIGTGTQLNTGFYWENKSTVPEPGSLVLLSLGLLGMGLRRRRIRS